MRAKDLDILPIDEAYEHLAKSIVVQAIEDYRRVLHGTPLFRGGNYMKHQKEIERFFKSEWFSMLCDWDGITLMKIIKEQEETDERNSKGTSSTYLSY